MAEREELEVEHCGCIHHHEGLEEKLAGQIPDEETLGRLAFFFKLYSEMCVCDLAQTLDMTQSAISHQLRMLKQMALVKNRRDGKTVYYSLSDGHISTILSQGMEHIEE